MASPQRIGVVSKVKIKDKDELGIGIIRFIGATKFHPGKWVGVELAKPAGKNDGSVQGVRYFKCRDSHGIFIKPAQIVPVRSVTRASSTSSATPTAASTSTRSGLRAPTARTASAGVSATSTQGTSETKPARTSSLRAPTTSTTAATSASRGTSPSRSRGTSPSRTRPTPIVATPTSTQASAPTTPTAASTPTPGATPTAAEPKTPVRESAASPVSREAAVEADKAEARVEEREEIKAATAAHQSIVDKLMGEIRSLTEWKRQAQLDQRAIRKELHDAKTSTLRLKAELDAAQASGEKEAEKTLKEKGKEVAQLRKELDDLKLEHEDQLEELNETVEMLTMDKEFAETKAEDLEKEMDELRGEMDLLRAKTDGASAVEGGSDLDPENLSVDARKLAEENQSLKAVLMKLRDMSLQERRELEKKNKELEHKVALVPGLQEKLLRIETELLEVKVENDELNEALDEASEANDMVEQLTETNLNISEELADARATIEELEALRDMSEELEEHQSTMEKRLRTEMYAMEIKILDLEGHVTNQHQTIDSLKKQIAQYRERMHVTQQHLRQLSARAEAHESTSSELSERSRELVDQNRQLRSFALNSLAREIEHTLAVLDAKLAREHLAMINEFIPTGLIKADEEPVLCMIQAERVGEKANLVVAKTAQTFALLDVAGSSTSTVTATLYSDTERAFALELLGLVQRFGNGVVRIKDALLNGSSDAYAKLGAMRHDISPGEQQIDRLLRLLQREELSTSYPVDELRTVVGRFDSVTLAPLQQVLGQKPGLISLRDFQLTTTEISGYSCSMRLHLPRLFPSVATASNGEDTADESEPKSDPRMTRIESAMQGVLESVRKAVKHLADRKTYDSSEVDAPLLALRVLDVADLFRSCESLCDESLATLDATDADSLEAVLRAGIADLIEVELEGSDDEESETTGRVDPESVDPLVWIAERLEKARDAARSIADEVYLAWEKCSATVQPVPERRRFGDAFAVRAKRVRASILEAEALREESDHLRETIDELKESQRQLVHKQREADEKSQLLRAKLEAQQRKEQDTLEEHQRVAEKHIGQVKMYEDAMNTLMGNIEKLEAENRTSRAKAATLEREVDEQRALLEGGPGGAIAPREYLEWASEQIQTLQRCIRFLRQENTRLKVRASGQVLSNMPRLGASSLAVSDESNERARRAKQLSNEMSSLARRVALLRAAPRVVDLTTRTSTSISTTTTSNSLSSTPPAVYNGELAALRRRCNEACGKAQSLLKPLRHNASTRLPIVAPLVISAGSLALKRPGDEGGAVRVQLLV